MSNKWIVVGISGATCSGKSTLAKRLHAVLPQSIIISQDDYFHPPDSSNHVKVEALGHLNWEIMTALDMPSMRSDVRNILLQDPNTVVLPSKAKKSETVPSKEEMLPLKGHKNYPFILILEGFLILNDTDIFSLCDLHYYLTLTREECWDRRKVRVYDPPDIPGYFDLVVWPEYVKHRDELLMKENILFINGIDSTDSILATVLKDITNVAVCKNMLS